jgi:hypothetical protein
MDVRRQLVVVQKLTPRPRLSTMYYYFQPERSPAQLLITMKIFAATDLRKSFMYVRKENFTCYYYSTYVVLSQY